VRSRINSEPAFDPLTLFKPEQPAALTLEEPVALTSEEPVALTSEEPVALTSEEAVASTSEQPAALTPAQPAASATTKTSPAQRPPVFVEVHDPFRPQRGPSRAAQWSFTALVLMVAGVLIGYASGYIATPRFTERAVTTPQVKPDPVSVEPAQASTPPVTPAATETGTTGLIPKSTAAVPRPPVEERPSPPAEGRVRAATVITRSGSIDVMSRPPGAAVALDGRVVGQTPLSIPNVPEGTHVIGIEAPGFSRWATSVQVERGKATRVGASLSQ
jgi:hypothetical protein